MSSLVIADDVWAKVVDHSVVGVDVGSSAEVVQISDLEVLDTEAELSRAWLVKEVVDSLVLLDWRGVEDDISLSDGLLMVDEEVETGMVGVEISDSEVLVQVYVVLLLLMDDCSGEEVDELLDSADVISPIVALTLVEGVELVVRAENELVVLPMTDEDSPLVLMT